MNATDRVPPPGAAPALLLAALVLGSAAPAQAPADKKELVADVIAQGNRNVATQQIIAALKTRPGAEYRRDIVAEDVRTLYQTGSFADVRVTEGHTPQGVVVYFQFREPEAVVREVVYQGAKHLRADELEHVTGLHKGAPLNPVANCMAREAIVRRYQEDGRLLADVQLVEGGRGTDGRVVFRITEGPVCRVARVEIVGCTFVSPARLKTQIGSTPTFLGLPLSGKYSPLLVEDDMGKLTEYYRGFGFHDVRVSREVQVIDPGRVTLIFHVREGPRYRVASVNVSGARSMKRDEVLTLAKLRPDQIYSQAEVDADKERIKAAFGYRGYNVRVHERLTWGRPGQVAVAYEVEE